MKPKSTTIWLTRLCIGVILALLLVPSVEQYRPVRRYVRGQIAKKVSARWLWTSSWSETRRKLEGSFLGHHAARRWLSYYKYHWLNATGSQVVKQGPDGWLFLANMDERQCMNHAQPFTDLELVAWGQALENWRVHLSARNIPFIVVIAPDKHTIYDYLSPVLNQHTTPSRLDQLYNYLETQTAVRPVDVRPALLQQRRHHKLYYKTDTHWNELGAYFGFEVLAARLRESFPQLPVTTLADYTISKQAPLAADLTRLASLEGDIFEAATVLQFNHEAQTRYTVSQGGDQSDSGRVTLRTTSDNETGIIPRLLMLRDSFATALLPFIASQTQHGVFLWEGQLDLEKVDTEQPSVVIFEAVERHLQLPRMQPQPICIIHAPCRLENQCYQ